MINFPVEAVVQYTNKTVTSGIVRENFYDDSLFLYPNDNSKPFIIGRFNSETGGVYFHSSVRLVVMNDMVYENPEYTLARFLGGENEFQRHKIRKVLTENFTVDELFGMLTSANRR